MKLSTDKILQSTLTLLTDNKPNLTGNYLDIGSGTGELIELVKTNFNVSCYAVDYTDTLMQDKKQKVDVTDLNHCSLPYDDNFLMQSLLQRLLNTLKIIVKFLKKLIEY